ncbi:bifunctional [glutamine synthetase] adenylyltransferase/[glutamine synthetase]-adenylyl-L-tyrosine phosphorylase [Acidiphilium acidophilum]|uniref:bifunctional [glutamine synthetase] adenylyltransferase/[glutamine synthetase]-adenylyl-L-tyrosine phosphorylase n=1 Tax=Acidiphilium acidophilum TaxID=76588 RepID=UPI002E8E6D43|nr:bifunctional [glutamine synthetase] adenylyltransferase/[glutamine synthetase]-adenylyl-L-tyrosine phosphorylase [Acidiphilium acidophilum]
MKRIAAFAGPAPGLPPAADAGAAAALIEAYAALGAREARYARTRQGRAVLEAIGGNAPYLAGLALREPDILPGIEKHGAGTMLAAIMARLRAIPPTASRALVASGLRAAKRRAALTIALADIAGVWRIEAITQALSDLADASIACALGHLLRALHDRGTIVLPHPARPGLGSHFAVLGMGKLGARELNYSSDIDLVLLFDPSCRVYRHEAQSATTPRDGREDMQSVMARLARDFVPLLAERDHDGMVFRVDLRLRPDPAATPPVLSVAAALTYYESHGRTWERAAFSKARPVAGDLAFGAGFLEQIRPFIWRRNLDFAAIGEIHDMKRRIDQRHRDRAGEVLGRDVKLGRGGIREIEFMVQTLELVWGGHEPALRIPATLPALRALAAARHLPVRVVRQLAGAYRALRGIEHRLQMVDDRQTHDLPETPEGFAAFAVFMGEADAEGFARRLDALFEQVHGHFAAFFDTDAGVGGGIDPGDRGGLPVVFQEEVAALGFRDVQHLGERLRAWREGGLPALRAARARELLDAILPGLLGALARQADPDLAFRRFDQMLERQRAGIPLLSLFQRNPGLLDRLAAVLGAAAPLAEHLAAHSGALDALLAPVARFTRPAPVLRRLLRDAADVEHAVNAVRRFVRREEFHLSVAMLETQLDADAAGTLRSDLARAALAALLPRVMADFVRRFGRLRGGKFAIVALGRVGAGEMLPGSDLDLMLIYDHPAGRTAAKLPPSTYFIRLAHALVGAITAQGLEGPIYQVDMRLRPSGNKGPVAVPLSGFVRYHAEDAWTWERLALVRARVLTASAGFAPVVEAAIDAALHRAVPAAQIRADTVAMRVRLAREAPARDRFDLKHRDGGMMELAFIVEALVLIHVRRQDRLHRGSTREVLAALGAARILPLRTSRALIGADHLFRTVQRMIRITGLTAPEAGSPPAALAPLLAAVGVADFTALLDRIDAATILVRAAFVRHIGELTLTKTTEGDTG